MYYGWFRHCTSETQIDFLIGLKANTKNSVTTLLCGIFVGNGKLATFYLHIFISRMLILDAFDLSIQKLCALNTPRTPPNNECINAIKDIKVIVADCLFGAPNKADRWRVFHKRDDSLQIWKLIQIARNFNWVLTLDKCLYIAYIVRIWIRCFKTAHCSVGELKVRRKANII